MTSTQSQKKNLSKRQIQKEDSLMSNKGRCAPTLSRDSQELNDVTKDYSSPMSQNFQSQM